MRAEIEPWSRRRTNLWTAGLMLAVFPAVIQGQAASSLPPGQQTPPQVPTATGNKTAKLPSGSDRQRAVKLFLDASKLFEKEKFEVAAQRYQEAATLDPSNADYPLAAALARSHAVTALIQAAAKDRLRGDKAAERAALTHALELDPRNIQIGRASCRERV